MGQIREAYPYYTQDQLSELKENEFVNWFKFYVSDLDVHNAHEIDLVVDYTRVGDNEVFSDLESYADFLSGSILSASSPVLGSPFTQRTSVPQQQPAAPSQVIEDRLLNEVLLAPGRELLPKLSRNGEPNTSW
ncbi:hypothetical protein IGI04_023903 [Brassica rapa subsp. trilocularis]|uniref:BSD domain-containing protein n=1 Tax=Brassica rapa subsp. trilocularis TaxID=1813537 RepID=A0ABQ7M7R4_BRACM|nr:hypothetical protein IGI04_023903 [Brassica rapa subsp. trilocularis]